MIRSPHAWRRWGRAVFALALLGTVAGCTWSATEPAPVFLRDGMSETGTMPMAMTPPPPSSERRVVVRPGQSLRGLAHAYHVTEHQIIAANHLRPPYELRTGQRLLIPGAGGGSPVQTAALPPVTMVPAPGATAPMPPIGSVPPAAPMASARSPAVIPLDDTGPARPTAPPPPSSARPPATLTPSAAATRPTGEPSAAEQARAESNPPPPAASARGGRFGWPVRGRILAGYGVASGGAHNDGINIAAPRGAPVAAVEGGEVAYAGNELKGYGNLVLIKHPDGFITAYAHCEELLVKRGEKVNRGQVIAKVGSTGGVSEPQLHFELRRGKQPIDPKEFLGSSSSAGGPGPSHQG